MERFNLYSDALCYLDSLGARFEKHEPSEGCEPSEVYALPYNRLAGATGTATLRPVYGSNDAPCAWSLTVVSNG